MFRELRIGQDLLGKFQSIFVLLVFVAFLQRNRTEEVNTHREIDRQGVLQSVDAIYR